MYKKRLLSEGAEMLCNAVVDPWVTLIPETYVESENPIGNVGHGVYY